METLTITESWAGNFDNGTGRRAEWTARNGRTIVARATAPMEMGMVDSDILRRAIAEALEVDMGAIRFVRKRSDGGRIVPRLAHVQQG